MPKTILTNEELNQFSKEIEESNDERLVELGRKWKGRNRYFTLLEAYAHAKACLERAKGKLGTEVKFPAVMYRINLWGSKGIRWQLYQLKYY